MTFVRIIIVFLSFFNSRITFGWVSAAHFGAAIESHSSTGFQNTLGSTVFFDLLRGTNETIDYGIRTMATGARQSDKEFYRLLTGPVVQFAMDDVWLAQFTTAYFQESSSQKSQDINYQSRGYSLVFGVEKIWYKGSRIEVTSGGFWGVHRGNLRYHGKDLIGTVAPLAGYANATQNQGQTRGIEISLRTQL
jgi:hypothetical protein